MSPDGPCVLISVSDKRDILPFARTLSDAGYTVLSTGGTAARLREGGVDVVDVSEVTGSPEMFDGRVKTLHPAIHGGVLARRGQDDSEMAARDIPDIRMVVVNLYPFEQTVRGEADVNRADVNDEQAAEMIDIGGPTLLRAAAKNFATQTVVCDPDDYEAVAEAVQEGGVDEAGRRELARKAFGHTARYDAAIVEYFDRTDSGGPNEQKDASLPEVWPLGLDRREQLRYGENPHQQGALYETALAEPMGGFEKFHGKALSYNNLVDLDAAVQLVAEFDEPAAGVIKHTNPAGCAVGETLEAAYDDALACDPMSAFGGIVALNRPVDEALGEKLADRFWEVICAPAFTDTAREVLTQKKNVRLVRSPDPLPQIERAIRATVFGYTVQTADPPIDFDREAMSVPTERAPTEDEWAALELNWRACKHVKSNAIVMGRETRTVGVGAGQMSRVDAVKFAVAKAREDLDGAVMASDAFFPFRDGIDAAHEAGIRAVIQPGGSKRDPEVIEACDEHDIAMVMTGRRHFRH